MFLTKNKIILLVPVAFAVGWISSNLYFKDKISNYYPKPVRENPANYKYINPPLYADNSEAVYPELNQLKNKLSKYIKKTEGQNNIDRVSVYFRDLNTNMWTGVDEDAKYIPSSMLKVLTLITYLKLIEDSPDILNQKLPYTQTTNTDQHYVPEQRLENGVYNIEVLLGQSIVYSDNDAHDALTSPIEKNIADFYQRMQLSSLPSRLDNFFSSREMSRIFRTLFNSSYLSESYSEQALELLTRTNFNRGLVAGVDPNIIVAHKFGEYTEPSNSLEDTRKKQLHDCGIVYYPNKPYVLCVMTEGDSFDDLEGVIKDISRIAFVYVKENDIR